MKSKNYQERFYRDWVKAKDLHLSRLTVGETDLQILTDRPIDMGFIKKRIVFYRRCIEDYVSRDRRFLTSLKPISVRIQSPVIVRQMARQANKAGVGPMAAVAGAIAQYIGKDLMKKGCKEAIIENGGDIFLKTRKTRHIGIYAGSSKLSGSLSLRIKANQTPMGIATSSGSVGHSLNFGKADAVVVFAKDAILADATATAASNLVRAKEDIGKTVDFVKKIRGISGLVIIIQESLASWGKIEFC